MTGAGGFVGRRLVAALGRAGAETHAVLRPGGRGAGTGAARVHRAEVGDPSIHDLVVTVRPTVVFHLAVDRDDSAPDARLAAVRTNVLGTALLLEASASAAVVRFVHLGGALEYAPVAGAMAEDAAVGPQGYYGATKAAASMLVVGRAAAGDLETVVLRPFLVYGPGQPADRLIPTVLRAARDGGEVRISPGRAPRDWVHVDDVVAACLAAADRPGLAPGMTINVGSGEEWTNEEVVGIARKVTGRPIAVARAGHPARPWDRAAWRADTGLLRGALGVAPRGLVDGLGETWRAG